MDSESLLRRLADDVSPKNAQKERVRGMLKRRIDGPAMLAKAKLELTPDDALHATLWQRILGRIEPVAVRSLFDRIRGLIAPEQSVQQSVKMNLFSRLAPVAVVPLHRKAYRWVAAFVVVVFVVQLSPVFFIAPATIAESSVLLEPTQGGVEVSIDNLWQPISNEIELKQAVALRTEGGEATILLHDNGNVRLAPNTTLTLNDVSDHSSILSFNGSSMTIASGEIWLQGLLPDSVRGFTVQTPQGSVTVHGGSVSIDVVNDTTHVEVWDRHATIVRGDQSFALVAGETVDIGNHSVSQIRDLPADAYKGSWVAQNLRRDAVHQREMAQMQEERHAAQAGILPNSPFYPVKRVAEAVDVLLTLDPQAKLQKQLEQANTRLNEAAALIAAGDTGASIPLDEYKQTLLAVASGSGGNASVKTLLQQTLAQNSAQLSAALPDDTSYLLKKTVLEASAQMPDSVIGPQDVTGTLLVDTLDALHQAVQSGSGTQVAQTLAALTPYLPALQSGSLLKPEVKKEAISLISDVADAAQQTSSGSGSDVISQVVSQTLSPYLPANPAEVPQRVPVIVAQLPSLTDAELDAAVQGALHRIFDVYSMPQSQENQLRVEMKKFENSPDEGRFLRRLYSAMPDGTSFSELVRHQIQLLREKQILSGVGGSGSGETK
ncbi:MAG TPA: DUF5667 domain-containing protein [Candidatus Peribacteraceae bacterium]|nr:DUF5667 domain-containing protein [Candidatus Peribacteraceae bacterium]